MIDLKRVVREKILNNDYCKFDLLEKLLPVEELVNERSWFLRLKIADMLDIKVEDIKPVAFNQWRRRLKQKELLKNKNIKENEPHHRHFPSSKPTSEIEKLNNKFIPTDPMAQKKETKAENPDDWIKPSREVRQQITTNHNR